MSLIPGWPRQTLNISYAPRLAPVGGSMASQCEDRDDGPFVVARYIEASPAMRATAASILDANGIASGEHVTISTLTRSTTISRLRHVARAEPEDLLGNDVEKR